MKTSSRRENERKMYFGLLVGFLYSCTNTKDRRAKCNFSNTKLIFLLKFVEIVVLYDFYMKGIWKGALRITVKLIKKVEILWNIEDKCCNR